MLNGSFKFEYNIATSFYGSAVIKGKIIISSLKINVPKEFG